MLTKNEAISKLNKLGTASQPFSFYCDFLGEQWCIEPPETDVFKLQVHHHEEKNQLLSVDSKLWTFNKNPISFPEFKKIFSQVIHQINIGNSFLTNLTFETPIETNLTLEQVFQHSQAKYKLLIPDKFVVFSPETFVKIAENKIYSHPMKGTIDAKVSNAREVILNDPKETAEHVTIVDLIRNDLSQVADEVTVQRFRYIDEIKTNEKHLLQVSSQIEGKLKNNWNTELGDMLSKLLPAGSISGAPKPETLRIIKEVESYDRGFYTGICGQFDGESLDTGVMIRFIKKENDRMIFCSGGGITSFSDAEKEYQEMVDKVYLPLH